MKKRLGLSFLGVSIVASAVSSACSNKVDEFSKLSMSMADEMKSTFDDISIFFRSDLGEAARCRLSDAVRKHNSNILSLTKKRSALRLNSKELNEVACLIYEMVCDVKKHADRVLPSWLHDEKQFFNGYNAVAPVGYEDAYEFMRECMRNI